ncbi:MAG: ATP-binding cassette, subfamily bacterial CydC [Actinomycetota bacterium]|nr:ATP-binding cassette, subfamily bacterial CydC [Actinomycetota bacterium]
MTPSARLRRHPLARVVAALDPDPRRVLLAVLTGTLALGSAVALLSTSAWLISRAAQHPPVLHLQVAIVATRAFGISRGVLRYAERLESHDVALRGVARIREQLYRRLADADPVVVAGLRRGDLLARVGADVDTLADLVVRTLLPFAVALTTATASAVLLAVLLPGAGLVTGAGLAVAALVAPPLAGAAARRAEREAASARAELSAEALALLDGVGELTVAGAVRGRLDRLAGLDTELARRLDHAARPAAAAAALSTAATGLAVVGALALGVRALEAGALDPVLLAVVTLTPLAAAEAVTALPAAATGLVRARAAAERVLDLLDAAPGAAPAPGPGPVLVADPVLDPVLVASGLDCGWPGREPALTGFDLVLPPGRRVAVVGASGGGKTTLLLTLAGLIPPAGGTLALAPVDSPGPAPSLADLDPATARRTVSFTAEDAHVFTTTVRENLRVARPGCPDEDLVDALARAGLGHWPQALPSGLDTMLGSGGAGLSGGERRRLLLARSLLVGAGILLLDEPGEHLDPATADALVHDVLSGHPDGNAAGAGTGPAVVVVTHRLAPLGAADEVILIGNGRVLARGTHEWLLRHSLTYRDAWQAERGAEGATPDEFGERSGG